MTTRINSRNTLFSIGIHPAPETNIRASSRTHRLVDELYIKTIAHKKQIDNLKKEFEGVRKEFEGVRKGVDNLGSKIGELRVQTDSLSRKIRKDNEKDKLYDAKMRKKRKKSIKEDQEMKVAMEKYFFFVGKPPLQIIGILCQGTYDTFMNKIKNIFTRITSALS